MHEVPQGFKTQTPRPEIPVALGGAGWARGRGLWPSHPPPVKAGMWQGKKKPLPPLSLFCLIFFFIPYQFSPAWSCPEQSLPLHNIKCMLKTQLFRGDPPHTHN